MATVYAAPQPPRVPVVPEVRAPAAAVSRVQPVELRVALQPWYRELLSAPLSDRILRRNVADGAEVRSGQVVVELACPMQRSSARRARAALDLASLRARLVEKADPVASGTISLAQAEVRLARAQMDEAQTALEPCRIRAPRAGRVVYRVPAAGAAVHEGQTVLEILDESRLRLEFSLAGPAGAALRPNTTFLVRDARVGALYRAAVVESRLNTASEAARRDVTAVLPGRSPGLVSGAIVIIRTDPVSGMLLP